MNILKKNTNLKIVALIFIFLWFLYFELTLIDKVILFDISATDSFSSIYQLVFARVLCTIILSITMSSVAISLASDRRLKAIGDKWLRDKEVKESLSTYLLTLFDHLVTFYYLARIRIITDTILLLTLSFKLITYLSFQNFIIFILASIITLILLSFIYLFLSKVSTMTTETEKNLVECAVIINERGVAGWKESNINRLMSIFTEYSHKLSKLYTFRLSISQLIRTLLEFFVFALVASGIIIGSTSLMPDQSSSGSVAMLLIISRIAPLTFTIITMASTLGLGAYAKKIYF